MLLLVRHGQTDANERGLLQGRIDLPLSDLGRRQAAALTRILPASGRVIASPLTRAVETARAFGRPVSLDERWIELDYGEYDGRSIAEVPESLWREWRRDPEFVPGGGESLRMLGQRVRDACDELVEEATETDVVVVSHVSPVKAGLAWALGVDDAVAWRMFVQLASVARIAMTGWGPSLRSFNEVPDLGTSEVPET
jgi:broad specificity phosphatase PhoE